MTYDVDVSSRGVWTGTEIDVGGGCEEVEGTCCLLVRP